MGINSRWYKEDRTQPKGEIQKAKDETAKALRNSTLITRRLKRILDEEIKKTYLKEEAYEELRVLIVTNGVAPGDILNEKDLMARLSIGRSPLREILFRLQEENLIKPLPRLGYMVTTVDIFEVRELVELRRELEGYAGFLAAQRITNEQLEDLRTIIREAETDTAGQLERLAQGVDLLSRPSGPVTLVDDLAGTRVQLDHPAPMDLTVVWTEPPRAMVCLEPWTGPRQSLISGDRKLELAAGESLALCCTYRVSQG